MTATLCSPCSPAFLVDQQAVPARRAVDFLCVLPAAVPGVFMGIGYLLMFNRPGIPLAGTAAILVLAFTFANLPFSYQVVRAGLAQIDRHLADAAADLGASRLRILWDVHLRLLLPACVAAWTATFVSCITNLSIAIFLVTPGTPSRDLLDPRPDRRQSAGGGVGANHGPAGHHPAGGGARLAVSRGSPACWRGLRCMRPMSSWSASASASARSRRSPR